jgi:hypothetical protein
MLPDKINAQGRWTITIVRGSRLVAEIGPAHRRTGADLRAALADVPPPDEGIRPGYSRSRRLG